MLKLSQDSRLASLSSLCICLVVIKSRSGLACEPRRNVVIAGPFTCNAVCASSEHSATRTSYLLVNVSLLSHRLYRLIYCDLGTAVSSVARILNLLLRDLLSLSTQRPQYAKRAHFDFRFLDSPAFSTASLASASFFLPSSASQKAFDVAIKGCCTCSINPGRPRFLCSTAFSLSRACCTAMSAKSRLTCIVGF